MYNSDFSHELLLSINELKEAIFTMNRRMERIENYVDMIAGSTHTIANGYFEYLRNIQKGGDEE